MSENVTLQLKVHGISRSYNVAVDEINQYTIKLGPDESGGTDFALPGLENPHFIAIFVEDYQSNLLPVEVMLSGMNGDRVACMPFAVFTADTITSGDNVGGMQSTNFGGGLPVLHFINGTEQEVRVTVIAGE